MKSILLVLITVLIAMLGSFGARAEENLDDAKAAFIEGRALFEKGEYEAAAIAFRKAYTANPSWKLFYNIGQCEAAAKHHGLAFEAFETYLAQGGDDVPADRRDEVVAEVARLRNMIGSLEVVAPGGAEVIIGAVPRGKAPLPGKLKVAAGVNHELIIRLGDEVLLQRVVRISSGDTETVEVQISPDALGGESESDPEVEEPELQTAESSGRKIAGWVLLGAGSLMVVGGSITGVGALKLDKDITSECSEKNGCLETDRSEDVNKRDALALTTDILIGAGAGVFVTGVLLLTVFNGSEETNDSEVAVVPVVGQDRTGAALEWRF